LQADALVKGLRATLFASSGDEAKQLLTGVHLQLHGNTLECAATDGHRLAVLQLENAAAAKGADPESADRQGVDGQGIDSQGLDPETAAQDEEPFAVTVPARSLRELERLLSARHSSEPLSLFSDRGQVVVHWADQLLTSRTLDGTYPNYRQLIPASFTRRIVVERRPLLAALERVAVLADQQNNVVKISVDAGLGKLLIQADGGDVGSGSEAVAAEISGDDLQIAFNVRYLLDGLKAMTGDQLAMSCNAPTTPVVLTPIDESRFTYLVMPVQVRQ
jgi:DNA polymerase-3 subunit beta